MQSQASPHEPFAQRITTPFGRRALSPTQITTQVDAAACPAGTVAHRWRVLHDLTAARTLVGLSAPTLTVLEALLRFLPGDVLKAGADHDLIVFPSNRSLSERARGISEASLRRHLAALVEGGWLIRRDSPNGKRYVRRGQGGQVAQVFGFDLTPLVARVAEIAALAEAARAEVLALDLAREKVALLRRDCAKLIEALSRAEIAATGRQAPAGSDTALGLRAGYAAALAVLPRRPTRADLEAAGLDLEALTTAVSKSLANWVKTRDSSGNGVQDERHYQNSKPEASVREKAVGIEQKPAVAPSSEALGATADPGTRSTYPLASVLDACPQILDFAPGGIRSWHDMVEAAGRIRPMLGISPSAWDEARSTMGVDAAAVTLAAILERHDQIKSPGAYLRSLTARKRDGAFSLGPVLQALRRSRLAAAAGGVR
jgi:replication initiation protein RepC